jgi:ParB family chromosome partitioning protein
MNGKMSRLGRGIEELIQNNDAVPESTPVSSIKIAEINRNRFQPRKALDQEKLNELAESIKENGLIQPIIVAKNAENEYELIAGERRLEAAKLAGLTEIDVHIREVTDKQRLVLAIVENIQREDLSPMEEARAYEQLTEDFELTHLDISKIVGKDRATITNALRLLKLPESVQSLLESKQISAGHARAILSIDEGSQEKFANEIVAKQYSVRQAEEEATKYGTPREGKPKPTRVYERAYLKEITTKLKENIGSFVKIKEKGNSAGEIVIKFKSQEELETIVKNLVRE